jgi:DNA polymerase I
VDPRPAEFATNEAVALAFDREIGAVAVGEHGDETWWGPQAALAAIARIEDAVGPRWVWWTRDTSDILVAAGVRPTRCWDLDAVHRLLEGGWRAGPALTWAAAHGLDTESLPTVAPVDLFSAATHQDRR